jgi:hypothetical protein
LRGDEEHVSGWDLVYDNNGYIEIDPEHCGYSTFLGAAVPEADTGDGDTDGAEETAPAVRSSYEQAAGRAALNAAGTRGGAGAGRAQAASDDAEYRDDAWDTDLYGEDGEDDDAPPAVAAAKKPHGTGVPAGAKAAGAGVKKTAR